MSFITAKARFTDGESKAMDTLGLLIPFEGNPIKIFCSIVEIIFQLASKKVFVILMEVQ